MIAAADDAELADDIVDGGVGRDDRQAVDVTLEGHGSLPQSTFERRPSVEELVDPLGIDVALIVVTMRRPTPPAEQSALTGLKQLTRRVGQLGAVVPDGNRERGS